MKTTQGRVQLLEQIQSTPRGPEKICLVVKLTENYATNPRQYMSFLNLFPHDNAQKLDFAKKAILDVPNPDLACAYIDVAANVHAKSLLQQTQNPNDRDMKMLRSAFEEALTAGGLHTTRGSLVWDKVIYLENKLLKLLDDPALEHAQVKRVRTLWRRRLVLPLMDVETAWQHYEQWEALQTVDPITTGDREKEVTMLLHANQEAQRTVSLARPHELRISSARTTGPWGVENSVFDAWLAYIEHVGKADPWRTKYLYERALQAPCDGSNDEETFSAQPIVWRRYLQFLLENLPSTSLYYDVCRRAVRHCDYATDLWVELLRAAEESGGTDCEIREIFENALRASLIPVDEQSPCKGVLGGGSLTSPISGHLCILHTYSQYQRRRLYAAPSSSEDNVLEEIHRVRDDVLSYVSTYMSDCEPDMALWRFWAAFEFEEGDVTEARDLMETVLSRCASNSLVWVEFANAELNLGIRLCECSELDSVEVAARARKLFQRAIHIIRDPHHAAYIQRAWLQLEGRHGSVGQLRAAEKCCTEHYREIAQRHDSAVQSCDNGGVAPSVKSFHQKKRNLSKCEGGGTMTSASSRKKRRAATGCLSSDRDAHRASSTETSMPKLVRNQAQTTHMPPARRAAASTVVSVVPATSSHEIDKTSELDASTADVALSAEARCINSSATTEAGLNVDTLDVVTSAGVGKETRGITLVPRAVGISKHSGPRRAAASAVKQIVPAERGCSGDKNTVPRESQDAREPRSNPRKSCHTGSQMSNSDLRDFFLGRSN